MCRPLNRRFLLLVAGFSMESMAPLPSYARISQTRPERRGRQVGTESADESLTSPGDTERHRRLKPGGDRTTGEAEGGYKDSGQCAGGHWALAETRNSCSREGRDLGGRRRMRQREMTKGLAGSERKEQDEEEAQTGVGRIRDDKPANTLHWANKPQEGGEKRLGGAWRL